MSRSFQALLQTIHTLRAPDGCPWDQKQTLHDAARYLMDEAGEVVEATLENDLEATKEELADVLFMVCFCTEILGEQSGVDMNDIAEYGNQKLIRRHPHVFGDKKARDTGHSQELWNAVKAEEKLAKGLDPSTDSVLKDLPAATAPLHQAMGYQKDAARTGFDWPNIDGAWAKLHEELDELKSAAAGTDAEHIGHEVGDLLFSVVNLARHLNVQPDMALRQANNRFRRRFHLVEEDFAERDTDMKDADITALEASWQKAKAQLNDSTSS
ncbi:MAG: MazG family protein [Candidatus Krumholzibacteriia bacterium]|jgi:MazG family protein